MTDAFRDSIRSWGSLALTDIAYKLVAFALLTPATALLLRWLLSRTIYGSKPNACRVLSENSNEAQNTGIAVFASLPHRAIADKMPMVRDG